MLADTIARRYEGWQRATYQARGNPRHKWVPFRGAKWIKR